MDPLPAPLKIELPCKFLRNKEMYYEPYGQAEDQFSSHAYWCNKTHEVFGPDGEPATKAECCAGRPCYVK